MTVFTILKKKRNGQNLILRTLQGMILDICCVGWHPFGSLLVPFWIVLVLFWLHFELVAVPFRSLWLTFGSQISEITFWNTFSKAP